MWTWVDKQMLPTIYLPFLQSSPNTKRLKLDTDERDSLLSPEDYPFVPGRRTGISSVGAPKFFLYFFLIIS